MTSSADVDADPSDGHAINFQCDDADADVDPDAAGGFLEVDSEVSWRSK